MRSLGSSGVWELFVPGVGEGTRYKSQVLGADGVWRDKADPMASADRGAAGAPRGGRHSSPPEWRRREWMAARARTARHASR